MAKDWVCDNCYAQNPPTAKCCRVCGLMVDGSKPSPEILKEEHTRTCIIREVVKKDRRTRRTIRKKTTPLRSARGVRIARGIVFALWIVSTILMFGMWIANRTVETLFAAGGLEGLGNGFVRFAEGFPGFFAGTAGLLGSCWAGLDSISFARIGDLLMYPVDRIESYMAGGLEGFRHGILETYSGMAVFSVFLWLVCLILTVIVRLVRWHRMDERKGIVFSGYGCGALIVDLLTFVVGVSFSGNGFLVSAAGMRMAAMFAMHTFGLTLALVLFVLAGLKKVRGYAAPGIRPTTIISRYKRDVIWGIVMVAVFAFITVFLSAGL